MENKIDNFVNLMENEDFDLKPHDIEIVREVFKCFQFFALAKFKHLKSDQIIA